MTEQCVIIEINIKQIGTAQSKKIAQIPAKNTINSLVSRPWIVLEKLKPFFNSTLAAV